MTALTFINARLIDPASGRDELGGLRVENGQICELGKQVITGEEQVIDARGAILCPALIDIRCSLEPAFTPGGETLDTLCQTAAAGGFGSIVLVPTLDMPLDTPEAISGLKSAALPMPMHVYSAGAGTCRLAGEALTEIGLMKECGSLYVSNGNSPISNSQTLRNLMAYASDHELWVACPAREAFLSAGTVASEGEAAGRHGLSLEPAASERMAIDRDAALAELTGARLMIDRVSTADGLSALLRARARGLEVCATVSIANLSLNSVDADGLNPLMRLCPPLRSEEDRQALINAVQEGLVDAIVSDHRPLDAERKARVFAEAAPGSISLETTLGALLALVHQEELEILSALRPLTSGPAEILGLDQGRLEEGAPADLVLIDGDAPWVFNANDCLSNRTNSAWQNRRFQGRVLMTMVDGKEIYNSKG